MKKEKYEGYTLTGEEYGRLSAQAPKTYDTLMEDEKMVLVNLQRTHPAESGTPQSTSHLIIFSNPAAAKRFERFCASVKPSIEISPQKT